MRAWWASWLLIALAPIPALAQDKEAEAAALFDRVAAQPARLRVFLQAMPKGGDIHHHLGGTPYAEEFIAWAGQKGMCVSRRQLAFTPPPCTGPDSEPAKDLGRRDERLYGALIEAMSVRGRNQGLAVNDITGHQDFFSSFDHFVSVGITMPGPMLASAMRSAAANGVSYLETMPFPSGIDKTVGLVKEDAAFDDFPAMLERISPQLPALVDEAIAETTAMEGDAHLAMGCGKRSMPPPKCRVTVRYQAFAFRALPPRAVFGQLAFGFALAEKDPRFVGINIVAPEHGPVAVADFDLHMRMLRFFADRHPKVKLALHAGELDLGLVPPYALDHHIRDSIEVAGARRIGHGVSIPYEEDAPGLLARMARERIAVEINLSSNDVILGVRGARHPLALYRAAGVPVVLSTDDEGVARSDMTNEYMRAATEQGLRYAELKAIARASLEYAFLPGESIWRDGTIGNRSAACRAPGCTELESKSEKAAAQLRLESEFTEFEQKIVTQTF